MAKIFSVDLGTNSIGWAIRDTDEQENQIIDYGVVVFKKGVGEGKSGEYSLAAERRSNRSKRRLYNAKRYRKWATLKVLAENEMCPISHEELRLWSIGDWQKDNDKNKNKGRVYPVSADFHAWLAMDFEKIGQNTNSVKLKPAFQNPYILRASLLENHDITDNLRLYKIGRAFYHLAQRRGFRTSRKSGKSTYGDNEYIETVLTDKPGWKVSQILQHGLTNEARRIRNSGVIQRRYFVEEFESICKKQELHATLKDKIYNAIYFVRPLKSQKGLVGKCTLEKGKTRIPESHPSYEIFRALQFINNIQWRETNSQRKYEQIPIELKKKILEDIFFKRFERGERKGKINDRAYFPFSDIVIAYSENFKYEFNYAPYINNSFELKRDPNVSSCPVIAGLMNLFSETWLHPFINTQDSYGIDFNGLNLSYKINFHGKEITKSLDYKGVWHLLFDFLQTKDNEEGLKKFCKNVLLWQDDKIDEFCDIAISQGYGSLSFSAVNKIIPFLEDGEIYSEAVLLANLKSVLNESILNTRKEEIKSSIRSTVQLTNKVKELLTITNSLIQQYFSLNPATRAKGVDNQIKEMAAQEVTEKLKNYFGETEWVLISQKEKDDCFEYILEKYLRFLNGEQTTEEKASGTQKKVAVIDYYKLPRLDIEIKNLLLSKYNATEAGLSKMYHPSDIDIYPKSKTGFLENPNPPSKGWKNPMAMRAMYELRKFVNYLLDQNKIDCDTKVVVEMARELNDTNKRWAIQTYQKNREDENKEFAKAIIGVAKEKYPNLNENDADNIDKVRLWWEQIETGEEVYKQIKSLKEDVQKYRLWKEQECMCIYTGKMIGITDLFDGTKIQFEHTLHLSKSFDNSLANLTVSDANYNMRIKKNQIPAQLKNYSEEWNGYTAIKPRFEKWVVKEKSLKERIDNNKAETKKAIRKGDTERKNYLIKTRHLLQFEYDYWSKKVKTFTVKEIPETWKNSQLVDTQIISKYARAYMKTVFNKVEVQKGTVTAEFRKIYGIMGDEKKDRSQHSHHALDAAILTLIPGSAKREEILRQYYEAIENKTVKQDYPIIPIGYSEFNIDHILSIKEDIVINQISKDQTLNQARKKIRKRGRIENFPNGKSGSAPRYMEGDAIRGQLHLESYFGAIKPIERNEDGFAVKENGSFKIKQKDGSDEIWIVMRKAIDKVNFDKDVIVDEVLAKHLKNQIDTGKKIEELTDFNGKKIRHIRCRYAAGRGFLSSEKALPIKSHVFKSKHVHKQEYLVQNADNYLFLLYEGKNEKDKIVRGYRILNRMNIVQNGITDIKEIGTNNSFTTITKSKGKISFTLFLKAVLKVGDRVILYKEHRDELSNNNLRQHLFTIFKFNEPAPSTAYVYLQHHLEARSNDVLSKLEDKDFIPDKYQPRIFLSSDKLNCLIENNDFIIQPDGTINLAI
jgi:CRISPR-associated endonuclease Csn1